MRDPWRVEEDLGGAAHHRVGPGERGAGRQLDHRDQVSLVLVGDKPGRSSDELPAGKPDQAGINNKSQRRDAQQPPDQVAIAERQFVESVFEAAEKRADRAGQHEAAPGLLLVWLEEEGAERRAQGQ